MTQRIHLTVDTNFNFLHLNRQPSMTPHAHFWDPENDIHWEGRASVEAWFQVAPEIKLSINMVPLSYIWGPKWIALANVQGSSTLAAGQVSACTAPSVVAFIGLYQLSPWE